MRHHPRSLVCKLALRPTLCFYVFRFDATGKYFYVRPENVSSFNNAIDASHSGTWLPYAIRVIRKESR